MELLLRRFVLVFLSFALLFSVSCGGDLPDKEVPDDSPSKPEQIAPDVEEEESTFPAFYESAGKKEENLPLWNVEKLVRQNIAAKLPLSTRCFYPDRNTLLKNLFTLKAALGNEVKTAGELSKFLYAYNADASGLDLYLDYYDSTALKVAKDLFGADPSLVGEYANADLPDGDFTYIVKNDDDFYTALKEAKAGDVIYLPADVVIDLSDWILAGDLIDFSAEDTTLTRKPLHFTLPRGVTLLGDRGFGDSAGAILKVTSYTDFVLTLSENSRISGLVIQGADQPAFASDAKENHSSGIRIIGDGAVIDNCEIAGFFNCAVSVENASGVEIRNNYIHHALGWDAGIGIHIFDSEVKVSKNLFSQLRTTLYLTGESTSVSYQNNVDAGNVRYSAFSFGAADKKDADYPDVNLSIRSFLCQNNTFLSPCPVFDLSGLPQSVTVQNNLFAYPDSAYGDPFLSLGGVGGEVYKSRVVFSDNCFDITAPFLASKRESASENGDERLSPFSLLIRDKLSRPSAEKSTLPDITFENTVLPTVISAVYYPNDDDFAFVRMDDLAVMAKGSKVKVTGSSVNSLLLEIISSLGGYGNYYTAADYICITENELVYGASSQDENPIGAYSDPSKIYTEGDYTVLCLADLLLAAHFASSGEVIYIPDGICIDLCEDGGKSLPVVLRAGVTLASNRGAVLDDGTISTGAILHCSFVRSGSAIVLGEDCRLTGLSVCGPDPASHDALWERSFQGSVLGYGEQAGHKYIANATPTAGISVHGHFTTVDNCEISSFSAAALTLVSNERGTSCEDIQIHHNYIHHNQMMSYGYGISHGLAYSEIYANLFNYNRHSIAGSGFDDSGYTAHDNIEMGNGNGHSFDMHGGKDRGDGTDVAGRYVTVYNNTFLGNALPYVLRGTPVESQEFYSNVLYIPRSDCNDSQFVREKVTVGRNIWNIAEGNTHSSVG